VATRKSKTQNSKLKRLFVTVAPSLLALTISAAAQAESMWVKNASTDIRDGKGAVYPSLGTIQKGQEVTVLAHDGSWVQVQSGNTKGWVYSSALSTSKVGGDLNFVPAGAAAANMNTGIAARGLQGDAEHYVNAKHLNKAPLESLIALRKSIQPAEYVAFTQEGNLGAK